MKFLIIFSLLLVAVYGIPPELEAVIKAHTLKAGGECKKEMGASDDDIAPMKLHHSLPTTEKGKCFLACMHKKAGFQDAAGKINKVAILAGVEQIKPFDEDYYKKVKQVVEICLGSTKEEENECATAYSMYACGLTEKAKVGLPDVDFSD